MINLELALQHLKSDPVMAKLIDQYQRPIWREVGDIDVFADVISAILSQQLSVRVADVIESRVLAIMPGQVLSPSSMAAATVEELRACGVSYAKASYLKAAADAALSGRIEFDSLRTKTDEEVVAALTLIHGVGKWTAEMLLISSLHRPDVFSLGDLGLRTAVARLYGVDRSDLAAISGIAQNWSPYRTVASKYLWQSLNNQPLSSQKSAKRTL